MIKQIVTILQLLNSSIQFQLTSLFHLSLKLRGWFVLGKKQEDEQEKGDN